MIKPPKTIPGILYLFILLIGFGEVKAQSEGASGPTAFSEPFDMNNPFEMDLVLDIKEFVKKKYEDEYADAKIIYKNENGDDVEKSVRIRPRGNSRKKICYLPPIRMDFDDEDYQVELFDSFGKVKLATTCQMGSKNEQFLIMEYLTYKIYETLTEASFKTYFLKINFMDSEEKKKPFTSYSFFIEDIDDVAGRNNAVEIENQGILPAQLDRPSMNLFSMYQYLISNVDWHIQNLHNVKLIKSLDHKRPQPIPIPYDLDYCGLVNTNYSVPRENIPIQSVTDRYWLGNCMEDEEFEETVAVFLDKKEEILNIFDQCAFLEKYSKTSAIKFINQFYDLIEKGAQSKSSIMRDCN